MSAEEPCKDCGFDGGEFAVEQRSLEKTGLCVACAFDDHMTRTLARLRKEDDPAQAVAVLEASQTESRKENDDDRTSVDR